jgi:TldD protein
MKTAYLGRMPFILGLWLVSTFAGTGQSKDLPLQLQAMKAELTRGFETLQKEQTPPYYLAYSIDHVSTQAVSSSFGAVTSQVHNATAFLRIDMRVGSYNLDNTHELRSPDMYASLTSRMGSLDRAPLSESPEALRVILWQATDKAYKNAVEMLQKVKNERSLKVAEEDKSDDFSKADPQSSIEKPLNLTVDLEKWAARIRKFSAPFKNDPHLISGSASFSSEVRNKYFVNTEGTALLTPANYMRIGISATTKADDGMEMPLYLSYFGFQESDLPSEEQVTADIQAMMKDLEKLRLAPVVDPYTGPAILSGKASGVFFHEILGHRLEGHRQKSEQEGQTFKKKVGQLVLPEFVSVLFDPTIQELAGRKLSGFFKFDDEGVKAQKIAAIDNGIMKNFLMTRSPIENFSQSNGHSRAQPGVKPVTRQSNLIVASSKSLPDDKLRAQLIEECKKADKPFGLVFTEVAGGFTMTSRTLPNAFNVTPLLVYRVYVDGRPDEVVRGVDLIGTPLTTFGKITSTGSRIDVFNGMCGAESGSVPVSAASPSILVSEIEVQKKARSQEKLPILPPPAKN